MQECDPLLSDLFYDCLNKWPYHNINQSYGIRRPVVLRGLIIDPPVTVSANMGSNMPLSQPQSLHTVWHIYWPTCDCFCEYGKQYATVPTSVSTYCLTSSMDTFLGTWSSKLCDAWSRRHSIISQKESGLVPLFLVSWLWCLVLLYVYIPANDKCQ